MSRTARLEIRLTPAEHEQYGAAAEREGFSGVATWLRHLAAQRLRRIANETKSEPRLATKGSSK